MSNEQEKSDDERLQDLSIYIENAREYNKDLECMISQAILLIDQNLDDHKQTISEKTKYFNDFLKPFSHEAFNQDSKEYYHETKKIACVQLDNLLVQTLEESLSNITGVMEVIKQITASLIDKLNTYQSSKIALGENPELMIEDYDTLEKLAGMTQEELLQKCLTASETELKTKRILCKESDSEGYFVNANNALINAYAPLKNEALKLKEKGIKNEQLKALNEQIIQHALMQEEYTRILDDCYDNYEKHAKAAGITPE